MGTLLPSLSLRRFRAPDTISVGLSGMLHILHCITFPSIWWHLDLCLASRKGWLSFGELSLLFFDLPIFVHSVDTSSRISAVCACRIHIHVQRKQSMACRHHLVNVLNVFLFCFVFHVVVCAVQQFSQRVKILYPNEEVTMKRAPSLLFNGFAKCFHRAKDTSLSLAPFCIPTEQTFHHYLNCTVILKSTCTWIFHLLVFPKI